MRYTQSAALFEALAKMKKVGRLIPEIDGLPHGAFFMLYRIRKASDGLTDPMPDCGVSVSSISARSQVSRPAVSQALRHLEQRGLIERRMTPHDRRVVRVVLTDEGNRVLDRSFGEFMEMFDQMIDRFGVKETEEFIRLLERLYTVLDQMDLKKHHPIRGDSQNQR